MLSTFVSSAVVSICSVAASGRRAPAGGIIPARNFRIIFSATSACPSARAASKPARDRPPALPRALWQPAQYCPTSAVCSASVSVAAAGAWAAAGRGPAGAACVPPGRDGAGSGRLGVPCAASTAPKAAAASPPIRTCLMLVSRGPHYGTDSRGVSIDCCTDLSSDVIVREGLRTGAAGAGGCERVRAGAGGCERVRTGAEKCGRVREAYFPPFKTSGKVSLSFSTFGSAVNRM